MILTRVTSSDREEDLADVDTGNGSVWLAESTTHTSLESIGSGTRQHLVDADDVVWVGADTEVETFLSCDLDEVPEASISTCPFLICPCLFLRCSLLVGADTGGFESLRAQLFVLVGDEVDACWELVDVRTLAAKIENANLWVWHTTVESRLRVWLVLAVAVATCWSACHFDGVAVGVSWVGVRRREGTSR